MSSAPRLHGKIKWFNSKKGFGFITPTDGGEDVFVHQTAIHAQGFRSVGENEAVEYSIESDADGKIKAVNVTGPNGIYVKGAPKPRPRSKRDADNKQPAEINHQTNLPIQNSPNKTRTQVSPPKN